MTIRKLKVLRMLILLVGMIAILWITLDDLEADDDVYNFYFQKGSAPQSVVQGGGGQTVKKPEEPVPQLGPTPKEPTSVALPVANTSTSTSVMEAKEPEFKNFSILLGYGKITDPVGNEMTYTLGFQYSFNRFLSARALGRFADSETQKSIYSLSNPRGLANRLGGTLALFFTPLRLDLLGHRFVEISAFTGADSYRRIVGENNVRTELAPALGIASMFGLNENVGIEVLAQKSTKATFIGGNIVFQF